MKAEYDIRAIAIEICDLGKNWRDYRIRVAPLKDQATARST